MSKPLFSEQAEEVKRPARIRQLLRRVRDSGSELQVQLQGAEQNWRTTISSINEEDGHILYGQLTPATWQDQPGLGSPARIYCPERANCIAYSALLAPVKGDDSLSYLQSSIPAALLHQQLRQQFRVNLPGRHTDVSVVLESSVEMQGKLVNISAGGCRCEVDATLLDLGDTRQLLHGRSKIADLLELEFQARIRHVEENLRGVALCLEFVELPPGQQQELQRALVLLERNTMRTAAAEAG